MISLEKQWKTYHDGNIVADRIAQRAIAVEKKIVEPIEQLEVLRVQTKKSRQWIHANVLIILIHIEFIRGEQ